MKPSPIAAFPEHVESGQGTHCQKWAPPHLSDCRTIPKISVLLAGRNKSFVFEMNDIAIGPEDSLPLPLPT